MFEISVITVTGRVLKLQVESTTNMCQVKQKIQEKEGIPPDQCRLIFGGKQIDACGTPSCTKDCRQLQDLGIGDGARINLVLRLAGD